MRRRPALAGNQDDVWLCNIFLNNLLRNKIGTDGSNVVVNEENALFLLFISLLIILAAALVETFVTLNKTTLTVAADNSFYDPYDIPLKDIHNY